MNIKEVNFHCNSLKTEPVWSATLIRYFFYYWDIQSKTIALYFLMFFNDSLANNIKNFKYVLYLILEKMNYYM